jgi:hypothetical protein
MSRNGFLLISDNSDGTYKRILAGLLRLDNTNRWGDIVRVFETKTRHESFGYLSTAARIWCEQMKVLAQFWLGGLRLYPNLVVGLLDVLPDVLARVENTLNQLDALDIAENLNESTKNAPEVQNAK